MSDKTMREVFINTFDTPDGRTMLYWIMDQCGYFQKDPRMVSPDLIAFAHRLLYEGGVAMADKAGDYMQRIMSVARMRPSERSKNDEISLEL